MIKIVIASFALLYGTVMLAQDGPKVVVFNSSKTERKSSEIENVIKFGMLEPFSGSFSVYYERVLTPKLSVEIGLGLTISDYLSLAINDLDDFLEESTTVAKIGPALSLGLRYYPGYIPEDFYIAPEFRFKSYKNTISYTDNGLDLMMNESKTQAIGRISFGYHYLVTDNIFWDFYGGFGIGKVNQTRLDYESVYDSETGLVTETYSSQKTSTLKPKLHIGIKLGVGF